MNSDQLELVIPGVLPLSSIPWGGQSPRALTQAAKALFLRREPQKDDRFFVDPDQFDLFHAAMKGPLQYGGAPSLLPLLRR